MASQLFSSPQAQLCLVEFDSYIKGFHIYQDIWMPVVEETLHFKWEATNPVDSSAVGVCKDNKIVGHVPFSILSEFLQRYKASL